MLAMPCDSLAGQLESVENPLSENYTGSLVLMATVSTSIALVRSLAQILLHDLYQKRASVEPSIEASQKHHHSVCTTPPLAKHYSVIKADFPSASSSACRLTIVRARHHGCTKCSQCSLEMGHPSLRWHLTWASCAIRCERRYSSSHLRQTVRSSRPSRQ